MLDFLDDEDNFDLNNSIVDAINIHNNIHNNNIHTSTGYKPIDLFYNTNEEIFNEVSKNIEKAFVNKNKYFTEIKKGDKLLIKKDTIPSGRNIKFKKNKSYIRGTIASCLEDFTGGLLLIRVDENQYLYNEGDEFLTDVKYVSTISEAQWNKIKEENYAVKKPEKNKNSKQMKYRKNKN